MKNWVRKSWVAMLVATLAFPLGSAPAKAETVANYSLIPPFVTQGVPPLVMLVLGRDHKLYYEAYNDISDLDGDGQMDTGYKPAIDYYGYFDSYKTYRYDSSDGRFEPVAVTTDKKIPQGQRYSGTGLKADGLWSGDFLNYLTTSRMDALRKVLYGGYRATDTATDTTLQRVYIPQDAHTWGKEYQSVARDGYDIRDYAPLGLPISDKYHLLASTTLADNGTPLLRVLPDSAHRIWEWVSKEQPVADGSLESPGNVYNSYPRNADEFRNLENHWANEEYKWGSGSISEINGSGNPFGSDEYYLNIIEGKLNIPNDYPTGNYYFAVNGDDAVDVTISGRSLNKRNRLENVQKTVGWYDAHSACDSADPANCQDLHQGYIKLDAGRTYDLKFRHQEKEGDDSYSLYWKTPDASTWALVPAAYLSDLIQTTYNLNTAHSVITDFHAKVQVCQADMPEANCKRYPGGNYKPIGLLQRHGEGNSMYFGLITGSYAKNTSGGVLRKNISSIADEIQANTGQFKTTVNGIIKTINTLRTVGYTYTSPGWGQPSYYYHQNCGWIANRPINEGECRMWGNPIAEMMYEGLRYFAGKESPTSAFSYDGTTDDGSLGLPKPAWQNPYGASRFPACAKPFMLVLSDVNPSYDSDQLPGVNPAFGSGITTDLTDMDVSELADTISDAEGVSGGYHYIGQVGDTYDSGPSAREVTSLADIRGLAPEEPTKQGSYYSASVAYYGNKTDISNADGDQKVTTYAVALASPFPRIEIPVNGQTITLIPFGKSVGGGAYGSNIAADKNSFQPTNSIVDVFMQELTPTYGKFRINFEDVEQGADHDMDAIVVYEYFINNDNTVTIKLTSEYAAGSIQQHMGYVISGTTADGTYLEVRDTDTGIYDDPDYYLDTPPGQFHPNPIDWRDNDPLPLESERTFSPGTTTAATLLKDPLWYAAKWGGFEESSGSTVPEPDQQHEWDKDNDGEPDTYFYVTNPLRLEEQLNRSFSDILRRTASGTAASVISSSRTGEGAVYQSVFWPHQEDSQGNSVNWIGQTHALFVDAYGNIREDTNANGKLDLKDDYVIIFGEEDSKVYKYADVNGDGIISAAEGESPVAGPLGILDINYLWSSSDWLNTISDSDILSQRAYASADKKRHIFTFVDANRNQVVDSGEIHDFLSTKSAIYPYLHALPPFDATNLPGDLAEIKASSPDQFADVWPDFLAKQKERVINYVRGQDQGGYSAGSYALAPFRSRKLDLNNDRTAETWRLGDIVYSSPTFVGKPMEDFDLIYKDTSYSAFYRKYRYRRHMVYVGANDGMLHAFNGGFYDATQKKFWKGYNPDVTPPTYPFFDGAGSLPELGAELWAYVPYNLLPHLYWLTQKNYDKNVHVAYVDLKPRIFDAKIFGEGDTVHVNGWGTLLVCGMRFGGNAIKADINGNNEKDDGEPELTSAYIIMDITDPENPPKVLAEIALPAMGFSTVYPAVLAMRDAHSGGSTNTWYLVFGSGPADAAGKASGRALTHAESGQPGRLYMVDLNKLGQSSGPELYTLNDSGALTAGANIYATLADENSFISDPVAVDYKLDFKADVVYFGTVSGSYDTGWGGKLRRIVTDNEVTPSEWVSDSVLIDLDSAHQGQPVTAAPAVGIAPNRDRWVYFGTGRFFNRNDVNNLSTAADQQSYYGIKEPYELNEDGVKVFNWNEVERVDLVNTSFVEVLKGGATLRDVTGKISQGEAGFSIDDEASFAKFTSHMDKQDTPGWLFDFDHLTGMERNLGQATLLGDILIFSTYIPSEDPCVIEGTSKLYSLYYRTGTAYKKSVFGEYASGDDYFILKSIDLGRGMVLTPNLYVGRKKGSKAFLQTSTGAIYGIDVANPGTTKSGTLFWTEE